MTERAEPDTSKGPEEGSEPPRGVLIAVYLFEAPAKKDFDAVMDAVKAKKVTVEGVLLASKDHAGEMHVIEAGDHLGRKGAEVVGGVGLVVGLFAPPLLASVVVGAAVGDLAARFVKHRIESGLEEKLRETLPYGAATLFVIYDHTDADAVRAAVTDAAKVSVADIDGTKVKDLKAGLAEAQAGLKG